MGAVVVFLFLKSISWARDPNWARVRKDSNYWEQWMATRSLLGSQVGSSPLLSLWMISPECNGSLKCCPSSCASVNFHVTSVVPRNIYSLFEADSSLPLPPEHDSESSRTGPSHKSVRMLSGDSESGDDSGGGGEAGLFPKSFSS